MSAIKSIYLTATGFIWNKYMYNLSTWDRMADPGRGSLVGGQLRTRLRFVKFVIKMKEKDPKEGAHAGCAPLDPPLCDGIY